MSSVNGHCQVGGGPVAVALHQAMAGNEIADEQTQTCEQYCKPFLAALGKYLMGSIILYRECY